MALSTMYPGKNNSPETTLTVDISASATSITVADASVLPDGPNIAVIGSSTDAEVILFTSVTNNTLNGVTRGIGGTTAKVWAEETVVARNFTMYDYETLRGNITDLDTRKANSADLGSLAAKSSADLTTDVNGVLPVANGGTGASSAANARSALGLGALALKSSVDLLTDVVNVLGVSNGGTGLTASPSLLTNLGSTAAADVFATSPRPGVTGVLPIANGGTNASTAANARTQLGITAIATRPDYGIGSTNYVDGQTALQSGKIYFYYTTS